MKKGAQFSVGSRARRHFRMSPRHVVAKELDPSSRKERKRLETRARLLRAAHGVMAKVGIDQAKIRDITEAADLGFGTFYNYYETKDALAGEVLDCMIHDCGVRNAAATRELAVTDLPAVMPTSVRLFLREAAGNSIWRWWALRPDLLVDRVRDGFAMFAMNDLRRGVEEGFLRLSRAELDQAWALTCWMMVGGMHDIVVGHRPLGSEVFVSRSIARAWGYDRKTAQRVSVLPLPAYGATRIDWSFRLHDD